jgi:hypothetical protein
VPSFSLLLPPPRSGAAAFGVRWCVAVGPMESSVTLNNSIALFAAMAVLAAVPSISVLTVTTRSVSFGFVHGAFTAMGVVAGDLLFILMALFGLAFLAEAMGSTFFLVKYLGGAYLIWLGIGLWKQRGAAHVEGQISHFIIPCLLPSNLNIQQKKPGR